MLKIRKLNMDSSWQLTWENTSLLIDPWLFGAEIDYSPLFNKQWHNTKPIAINQLDSYDNILISQHFSDHCHEETIAQLDIEVPIFTTAKGAKRIGKVVDKKRIQIIPTINAKNAKEWLTCGNLKIGLLPAPAGLKAAFSGIVFRYQSQQVVYCPHGYQLTVLQQEILNEYYTLLLITSFSTFKLPFYLGGAVNPGIQKTKKLIEQLQPQHLAATHDENKSAVGLVKKIATVDYPTLADLQQLFSNKLIPFDDTYQTVVLD